MDSLRREFSESETHGFLEAGNIEIRSTSAGLGWKRAYMSVQEEGPYRRFFKAGRDILLNVIHYGWAEATITVDGQDHEIDSGPGTITIVPDGVSFGLDLRRTVGTTHLYIRRRVFDHVVRSLYGDDAPNVRLKFCAAVYDPVLEQMCNAMRGALHEPSATSATYVEHILQGTVAYLARNHTSTTRTSEASAGPSCLTERQLQRTRELIEELLSDRIVLADIAREFNLGADHFGRLFKRATGVTLYQYIIRCRIERARRLLAETTTPIIEIAPECGFADQVHLTRAFRRMVGTTPAAFRRARR